MASQRFAYASHGNAGPMLVFQSGLGDGLATWDPVVPRLPADVRAFTYDRPGYGGSSASPGPRDPCTTATEMHRLLQQAGLKPPFVLVGHSLGGLYQYAYARLYPDEVAGLLLIDPTHPRHWPNMQADAPAAAATILALRHTVFSPAARSEFDDQDTCLATLPERPVAAPALLLFSSHFKLNERGAFEAMARSLRHDWTTLLPQARSREVAEAGHYVHRDQATVVATAIAEFAASVSHERPGGRGLALVLSDIAMSHRAGMLACSGHHHQPPQAGRSQWIAPCYAWPAWAWPWAVPPAAVSRRPCSWNRSGSR